MAIDEFVKSLNHEEIEKFLVEQASLKICELVNEVKESIVDHLLLEFINSNQKIGSA